MPIIRVEMFPGRNREQKRALVDALTDAFVRTCGTRKEAIHVVITEVEKDNWGVGSELYSDRFPD